MARARSRLGFLVAFVCLFLISASAATADHPPFQPRGLDEPPEGLIVLAGAVGIRVSVSNIDPFTTSADLDLTMYTRGIGPATSTGGGATVGFAGSPFFGYPALDFGDGSTIPTTTLALTTLGGGPGGSNVYRSLASFSHSYASEGSYTATAAMNCVGCFHASSAIFPAGSPVPATFTSTFDLLPTTVIGNQPLQLYYSGTTSSLYGSYSVRYRVSYFPIVTNTTPIAIAGVPPVAVPGATTWSLAGLAVLLAALGALLIRRG